MLLENGEETLRQVNALDAGDWQYFERLMQQDTPMPSALSDEVLFDECRILNWNQRLVVRWLTSVGCGAIIPSQNLLNTHHLQNLLTSSFLHVRPGAGRGCY